MYPTIPLYDTTYCGIGGNLWKTTKPQLVTNEACSRAAALGSVRFETAGAFEAERMFESLCRDFDGTIAHCKHYRKGEAS